ncbi:hypothetical protein [Leptobacterium sp. I13]|uniref:hypothetical protein n=1 Tax=Leptobacterium meishanense TaxID=3128904 RepID=UPI0030EDE1D4
METVKYRALVYTLPFLVIITAIGLAISPLIKTHPDIAIGITYDLTITAPLLYFLIIRKKPIPKITVVPVFVLGLILATFLLPESQQQHVAIIKTYLLPIIELLVILIILHKVYKGIKAYKHNAQGDTDFLTTLKNSTNEVLKNPKIAEIATAEIAMIYYGLFLWKKKKPKENEFTIYKESGITAIFLAIVSIIGIETYVFHILIMKWNNIAAWILTGTSIYAALQLLGHLKAIHHRYSSITSDQIYLKYGLFGNARINIDDIDRIELLSNDIREKDLKVEKLAILKDMEPHNIAIYFSKRQKITKIYGIKKECDILLFQIDDKNKFIERIQKLKEK